MKLLKSSILVSALLLALPGWAQAQNPNGSIRLKNEAFKEVEVAGEQGATNYELVPLKSAPPGEEVIYITTFTNAGDQPADDIVITNPVPDNVVYKAGSAFGAGTEITFSADGGETFAKPGELTVRTEGGSTRAAGPDDYTHVRWRYTGSLEPGQEGTVMFRAIIE